MKQPDAPPAEDSAGKPGPGGMGRRRSRVLAVAGVLAVVLAVGALLLPAPYVIDSPGPAFNTIGEVNSQPLIKIQGHESFPAAGSLDLTTVYEAGGPGRQVSFFDALEAWADPHKSVRPADLVYPPGITSSQVQEQNTVAMSSSKESAVAAALTYEKIPFTQHLTVVGAPPGSAAAGKLQDQDVLLAINGQPITDIDMLRSTLAASNGDAVQLAVRRAGAEVNESIIPRKSDQGVYQLGVMLTTSYQFPFDVGIELDNVGGPSAGMMFAVGIIDKLTPGDLTGGKNFAGTGTITAAGQVGPIGGIAQKMIGAQQAGAQFFLAPAANCGDVTGNIPSGLRVVKVQTLDDAVNAVRTLGAGQDGASLPTCG